MSPDGIEMADSASLSMTLGRKQLSPYQSIGRTVSTSERTARSLACDVAVNPLTPAMPQLLNSNESDTDSD